jgi:hypothetical protein
MRRTWIGTLLVLGGLALPAAAAEAPDPAWQKLASLVGEWQGTNAGKPARVSYRLVSNGTALMETLEDDHSSQMVTLYHADGASLLMTHYCATGNQSRMRAQRLEGNRLDFVYVDSSNVRSPEENRMTHLVLSFPDAGHLVHEWTAKAGAQEHVGRFEFTRAK